MKKMFSSIGVAAIVLATAIFITGCMTFKKEQTTVNNPAVYNIVPGTNGVAQTKQVSPASVVTSTKMERTWLPENYAFMQEDDMFGIDITMTSASSSLPNIKAGTHHGSMRWLPTSTNKLYAASMSASGSVDNKAVPFWVSEKGQFTAGDAHVSNVTDTNGTSADAGMIVPGTPNTQQK